MKSCLLKKNSIFLTSISVLQKIYSVELKWSKSRSVVSDSLRPHELYSSWNPPGQNTGVGSLSFLQGIFPTQRLNPGLLHCRQILYQLSHKESPPILAWVAYPFSSINYYCILDVIILKCAEVRFLAYYVNTYLIFMIVPLGLQSLKYFPSGLLQKKFC